MMHRFPGPYTRSAHQGRRGSILLGLWFVSILLVLTTQITTRNLTDGRLLSRTTGGIGALATTESGVELALWEFNYNATPFAGWSVSTNPWCAGFATCRERTMTLTASTGQATGTVLVLVRDIDRYGPTVRAIGQSQGSSVRSIVDVELRRSRRRGFDHAAFAQGEVGISVASGTSGVSAGTDSYDSTVAPYSVVSAGENGDLASSYNAPYTAGARLTLNGFNESPPRAIVEGDGFAGFQADANYTVSVINGGVLTGTEANLSQTASSSLEQVTMPGSCTELGSVSLISSGKVLAAGTYCADSLRMDGASAKLSTTGDVKLYVRNWVALQNGAAIEADGSTSLRPERLQMYLKDGGSKLPAGTPNTAATCSNQRFCTASSSQVTGTLYGPDANVRIETSTQFYGAIASSSLALAGNMHYDENLAKVLTDYGSGSLGTGNVSIMTWRRREEEN